MQQTIIAKSGNVGDRDGFCLGIIIEHEDTDFDVLQAARAAAAEYCRTDAGGAEVEDNNGSFNWGDFVNSVPDEICQRHGFTVVDTFITNLVVHHDELLNDI